MRPKLRCMKPSTVFLVDIDNTLLDNDRVIADLRTHLDQQFGAPTTEAYWQALEAMRTEFGYVDYLGALQRFRLTVGDRVMSDVRLLEVSRFLLDYPFPDRVYPGAFDAVARLGRHGPTVVLSDGDIVFQPRKVRRSGAWDAVGGRVLIYIHKEQMLDEIQRCYPADRYVMVDDKLRILVAMKAVLGERLTTVFVRQGHYAHDTAAIAHLPAADITIERIGDLDVATFGLEQGAST